MYSLITVCLLAVSMIESVNSNCYSRQPSPYRSYASQSLYREPASRTLQDSEPGCEAVTVFVLARHNIRNPTVTLFDRMRNELPAIRDRIVNNNGGRLCPEDYEEIRKWNLQTNNHGHDTLTDQGYFLASNLGNRFKERFPQLFVNYSSSDFIFANVYRNASWNTAVAFASGLFHNADAATNDMLSFSSNLDRRLLSFSDECEKHEDRDDDVEDELEEFMEQSPVQIMIERINYRLGFNDNDLSFDDIDLMYQTCSLEHSLYPRSPWCAAFTKSDLQILEYKGDMLHYQKFGPSDDINEDQTCFLMKNVLGYLNSAQGTLPKGVFYFAADDAVLPFLGKLGYFKDIEDLDGEDIMEAGDDETGAEANANREWRMSKLNPIGANLALILYQCQNGPSIKALLNEKPIVIDPCVTPLCPLSTIFRDVDDFADDCDFDEICAGTTCVSFSFIFIVFSIVLPLYFH